jgi:Mrp family chromosome partitioning ATPase
MRALLEEGQRSFDFVVIDCPPLFPVADAVVLQNLLDGFLVVVRERYAPLDTILRALDRLDADRLRGVVLNDHFEIMPRYRNYEAEYYHRKLA